MQIQGLDGTQIIWVSKKFIVAAYFMKRDSINQIIESLGNSLATSDFKLVISFIKQKIGTFLPKTL